MINQVKIGVLQKRLNMRGVFCHFFYQGIKIATFVNLGGQKWV